MLSKYFQILVVLLTYIVTCFAQDVLHISQDRPGTSFTKGEASLFLSPNLSEDRFIVAWTDTRNGFNQAFAQPFDKDGNKIGDNIPIPFYWAIAPSHNQELLILSSKEDIDASSFPTVFYNLTIGQLYNFQGPISPAIEFSRYRTPIDYFGCPAFGLFARYFNNGYWFARVFLGAMTVSSFDSELNLIHNIPGELLPHDSRGFAFSNTTNGDLGLFWFGSYNESSEETDLYAKFFNSDYELVADSVFIGSQWNTCNAVSPMQAITLQDSIYQVFFTTGDTLWFTSYSRNGNLVNDIDFQIIPRLPGVPEEISIMWYSDVTFGLSNISDQRFFLFVNQPFDWQEGTEYKNILQTSIHEFNDSGTPTSNEVIVLQQDQHIKGDIFYDGTHFKYPLFDFPASYETREIYLMELDKTLEPLDSLKVYPDVLPGANQMVTGIWKRFGGGFHCRWQDTGVGLRARSIDNSGNFIGGEFASPVTDGELLPNDQVLTNWLERTESGYAVGYSVYTQTGELLEMQEIASRNNTNVSWVRIRTKVIDNDQLMILLQDSTELRFLKYSRTNGVQKNVLITDEMLTSTRGYRIATDGAGLYWAMWEPQGKYIYFRGYNSDLEPITDIIANDPARLSQIQFLPNGRYAFINITKPNDPLEIIDAITGDTIATTTLYKGGNFLILGHELIVVLGVDYQFNEISLQVFDENGAEIATPRTIYGPAPNANLISLKSSVSDDNLFLAWDENVTPGAGFDVLGMFISRDMITGIKADFRPEVRNFTLSQNYPNPFNPDTKINFTLPQESQLNISIHNPLGQKIRTLASAKRFSRGEHRILWDGKNDENQYVASGIYFLKINSISGLPSTQFSKTIKMTLLR